MSEQQIKCPHCGAEIRKLGAVVKTFGWYDKEGVYYDVEFNETLEYYCDECGETLPNEIADKFFEETV